jgi:Domain of unknown function (DUF6265)
MKRLFFLLTIAAAIAACDKPATSGATTVGGDSTTIDSATTQPVTNPKLEQLAWFIGRWTQVEGPDLVSFEEWKRASPTLFEGKSWTQYHTDTVHVETIDLVLEGEDIYYIPTVPENNGPVRFKMTKLEGKAVSFENPEHDFPQKISYALQGDSLLMATISGSKGGQEAKKEFPLRRVQN